MKGPTEISRYPMNIRHEQKLEASLIFSRYHWENEFHRNIGSGLMQQEAYQCLNSLGFRTIFAGQEDSQFSNEILNSDITVGLAPGLYKLPEKNRSLKFLYTCNTHAVVKTNRLIESAQKWNLPVEDLPNIDIFLKAYQDADYYLIAENQQGIQNFINNGCDPKKIKRYNNCVNDNIWVPNQEKQEVFTFVSWSTHGLRKGLPALLAGWRKWYHGQPARLVLLGAGTHVADILFHGQKSGEVENGIFLDLRYFKGQDPELIKLVGSCQVGVIPTLEDAQSSTLLEMASCGLPVITTIESGVEFTDDFCTYVKADDSDSIAEALEFWFKNRLDVSEIGQKSRQYITKHHSWPVFRRQFSDIIFETVNQEFHLVNGIYPQNGVQLIVNPRETKKTPVNDNLVNPRKENNLPDKRLSKINRVIPYQDSFFKYGTGG